MGILYVVKADLWDKHIAILNQMHAYILSLEDCWNECDSVVPGQVKHVFDFASRQQSSTGME